MAIPKIEPGEMVLVRWLDAFNAPETWTEDKDIDLDHEYVVTSVGYHVGIGKSYLLICGDIGPGSKSRLFYIPIGMILGVERVGVDKVPAAS